MVSLGKENAFQLREYLVAKARTGASADPFKTALLAYLGLTERAQLSSTARALSLFQRCTLDGMQMLDAETPDREILRLLGQAANIDSTPMPWVSDVFGVMSVKWLVDRKAEDKITRAFESWIGNFLPRQAGSDRLNSFEKDIAAYINGPNPRFSTACIPLFFHYRQLRRIDDHSERLRLIDAFTREFRSLASTDVPTALLAMMIYVFDKTTDDVVLVPPNGWALADLVAFLEHIPVGLKRWTWEEVARTRGGQPVKWLIDNEYHVQNLLYVLLAPIFTDISDEVYLESVGQKTPRADLYLPGTHTLIEVKYRKNEKKSFADLIGELAEDLSLYRSDEKYKSARIVAFLWDHTCATQEHAKFKQGVMKMMGMDGCVAVCSPSVMMS